nr:unnamed protein product [Digitaria exilis]
MGNRCGITGGGAEVESENKEDNSVAERAPEAEKRPSKRLRSGSAPNRGLPTSNRPPPAPNRGLPASNRPPWHQIEAWRHRIDLFGTKLSLSGVESDSSPSLFPSVDLHRPRGYPAAATPATRPRPRRQPLLLRGGEASNARRRASRPKDRAARPVEASGEVERASGWRRKRSMRTHVCVVWRDADISLQSSLFQRYGS